MVTDLHAKKSGQYLQAFRKKCGKLFDHENLLNI